MSTKHVKISKSTKIYHPHTATLTIVDYDPMYSQKAHYEQQISHLNTFQMLYMYIYHYHISYLGVQIGQYVCV